MDKKLHVLWVLCSLAFAGCGSSDGDSNPTGSGGAQQGGSGGAQGGTSAGGSMSSGGSAGKAATGGAGGLSGSGGAPGGSGGTSSGASGSGGSGGANGGTGGTGSDPFSCGPLTCQPGEELCRREAPALPGGTEQQSCEPFPGNCAAQDCSCFCDPGDDPPCQTSDFCMCSDEDGRIELACAGA